MTAEGSMRYLTGARNAVLLDALGEVLSAAERAGIAVLPLKGAALCALGVYEVGEREFCDLDLLVRKKDLPLLAELLPQLNFERTPGCANDYVRAGPPDSICLPALDLHTEPFQFVPEYARTEELIWQTAQPLELGGVRALAPAPEWLALIALLNPLLHNACIPARAVEDARRIAGHFSVKWELVRGLADRLGVRPALEAALKRLELEGVEGCPLPRRPVAVDRLFFLAAGKDEPSKFLQFLLPAVLSPRSALEHLFPDREYFAARCLFPRRRESGVRYCC